MASISQLTARLVDLFGSPSTANPTKLLNNLQISPNGNVLVGTGTDDGVNKLQVTGPTKVTGVATATTGVQSAGYGTVGSNADGYGQFRAVFGNYGAMIRNDGAACYLLSTASGSQYGAFNSYRPFWWNLTNGTVGIATDAASSVSIGAYGTITTTGSYQTSSTTDTTGYFRTTGDIGGAFVNWSNSRAFAVQVDSQNDTSAYGGIRWTHWGSRHLAAIDAYSGGSGVTAPTIVMHFSNQANAWTFNNADILRGAGGYVIHTGNMAANCTAYTAYHVKNGGGVDMTWNWSGQSGQPPWLWGGSDGANMYVYNPSNFSVNYANTAGSVGGISTPAKASGNAFTFSWDGSAQHINITVDTTLEAYIAANVSDVRLKENIEPIVQDSRSLIDQVDFKTYDFTKSGVHVDAGVVAQQVEKFAPSWVVQKDTGEYEDGRFLNTQEMLISAMHAIQQLSAEVKSLKEQLKGKE